MIMLISMLLAPPLSSSTAETKKRKSSSLVKKTSSVTETEESESFDDDNDDNEMEAGNNTIIGMKRQLSMKSSIRKTLVHNVINCNNMSSNEKYQINHRGLECMDASMYISIQENLNRWGKPVYGTARKGSFYGDNDSQIDDNDDNTALEECMNMNMTTRTDSGADIGMDISEQDVQHQRHHDNNTNTAIDESSALLTTTTKITTTTSSDSTKCYSNVSSSSKGGGGRRGVVNEEIIKKKY